MNSPGRLILTGLGLLFIAATPSFATVVDNLTHGHASINATPAGVLFTEDYARGPSASSHQDQFARADFMTGGDSNASFTSSQSGLAASNTDCMLLKAGQTCSLEIGSLPFPIVLTYLGADGGYSLGKSGLLGIGGMGKNGQWSDDVSGLFINESFGHTTMDFVPPGFTVTPTSATPEPRAVSAIVLAGLFAGIVAMKRRRASQALLPTKRRA